MNLLDLHEIGLRHLVQTHLRTQHVGTLGARTPHPGGGQMWYGAYSIPYTYHRDPVAYIQPRYAGVR